MQRPKAVRSSESSWHGTKLWEQRTLIDAAMELYAEDAVLESPLVCHLRGTSDGLVRGRANLRAFVEQVFAHQPAKRRRFRQGFLTDGSRVSWEYPRETPEGDQMDIVESMDIHNGLIARHRVYWGWVSVGMCSAANTRRRRERPRPMTKLPAACTRQSHGLHRTFTPNHGVHTRVSKAAHHSRSSSSRST
jgi:SnoaL-like domain